MNVFDAAAAIISGICASLGLGGGGIMLLYLTLFAGRDQLAAQGINLAFFLPCAVTALILHAKNKLVRWKPALIIALGGLFGACAGAFLSEYIGSEWLSKIFGTFLLILGLRELFSSGSSKTKN